MSPQTLLQLAAVAQQTAEFYEKNFGKIENDGGNVVVRTK